MNVKVCNEWGVPNQFVIYTDKGTFFQSYESIIAFISADEATVKLDENSWDYSNTTGKYRNKFLGMDKKSIEKAIKRGDIILADLNKNGIHS